MRRSMNWTLEDNMVDGLFFCATLTGRRRGHTHLYKQERNRPTPVRRWLSRTQAVLGRVVPGVWLVAGVGDENAESFGVVRPLRIPLVIRPQCATGMSLLSDKLMSCCAACTNGYLDLKRRAFALDGRVSAEWSRCLGSMARRARDNVVPLRRSSGSWIPTRIGRFSAGVGRRHPVTIRKASLMVGLIRRVWALRRQTGAQYSAVEWTRARVAVRNVVAPAPQPEPASRLRSATRDVSF